MLRLCLVVLVFSLSACSTQLAHVPNQNAEFLEQYAKTGGFQYGHPRAFKPLPNGQWLFLRSPKDTNAQSVYLYDPATGRSTPYITRDQLVEGAGPETETEKARRERQRDFGGGITAYHVTQDGRSILFNVGGVPHVFSTESRTVQAYSARRPAYDPQLSPDGSWLSYVHKNRVWLQPVDRSARAYALMGPPLQGITYGLAEFVAQEEMGRMRGYWWGPDSRRILVQKTDERDVKTWFITDPATPQRRSSPRRYPAVGENNAVVSLLLFDLDGRQRRVIWDHHQYPYLATVRWQKDGAPLLVVQNRPQTELAVLALDVDTGATRIIHIEKDPAWINLDQDFPRWIESGAAWLWATERSGAWQIERRRPDGTLDGSLTPPLPGYAKVESWSDTGVVVALMRPSTERHLYRFPYAGGEGRRLTTTPGLHYGVFSSMGDQWIRVSRDDSGAQTVTYIDGQVEQPGPVSVASSFEVTPRLQVLSVPCGAHECDAAIIRPRQMQPELTYPALVYVYGGPHYKVVKRDPRRYLRQQWLADQGFVILMVDGRGTPGHGRSFERAIAGDLATAAVADQVEGIRALLNQLESVDPARVGIFGWSFGGYLSSMCLLRAPELFKAAVSGAPVTDWRWYDTHYTERYMGLIDNNRDGYDATSLVKHASRLKRPLMLVHGTLDDNVYPIHTLRFSDALFRAGIPHRVHYIPGYTHRVAGETITRRRYELMVDFFRTHLR